MEGQPQMLRIQPEGKRNEQVQPPKHQVQPNSSSSSPSHEFSFTISLQTPAAAKTKSSPPFTAIDLSPADEIFFHGHLLPLHLLSHLPVSPRISTNSQDSFTLPIKQLPQNDDVSTTIDEGRRLWEGKARGKSKSFSLFGIPKWRKNSNSPDLDIDQKIKPSKFDLLKRFVKPFLSLKNKRENSEFLRQSYSGNLRLRPEKKALRGRRGEFSAPASMITSPTNSGLLVASGSVTPTKSDSTMEELQAAIQAAIAHCKKSIATEDKIIVP